MGLFDLFRRNPKQSDKEWRENLLRSGRITEGVILDIVDPDTDTPKIVYSYCISGADYRSLRTQSSGQFPRRLGTLRSRLLAISTE